MNPRVLVVEDDPSTRELFAVMLGRRQLDVELAKEGAEALERMVSRRPDLVITDLQMPGELDGLDLARQVHDRFGVPVVVVTGRADLERAIGAIRAGVADFLTKPFTFEELSFAVERALRHHALFEELSRLRVEVDLAFEDMLGRSRAILDVQDLVSRVAPSDVPVLITGESGTGKELVARAIHDRSHRKDRPFLAVNCAALPASLLESELFGHVRGAFTDARDDKLGLFLGAEGGTLFLDEIGETPPEMQVKLLRALQEKKVRPVGGGAEQGYDARIISATNIHLEDAVDEGRFREDLYYRVNVVRIPMPPLRARGRDVLLLAQAFVERAARRTGRPVKGITDGAIQRLLAYDWPGNVRELENCIERGVALARGDEIAVEDLPEKLRDGPSPRTEPLGSPDELPTMEELERRHIVRVLEAVKGNKSKAARILGFDRRTLYRKAERYGLEL